MISYIKGTIEDVLEESLIVESGGIGYEIFCTASCFKRYSAKNAQVKIFTYMCVKEDGISLFGFFNTQERKMFLRLIAVGGVGAKTAMTILGSLEVEDIARGVMLGDSTVFSRVKGVGKKTAERIILELKDKVDKEFKDSGVNLPTMSDITLPLNVSDDAIMALMSLGYTKSEAALVISKIDTKDLSTEEIIYKVLKG